METTSTIGIDPGICNVGMALVTHRGPVPLMYSGECINTKGLSGLARLDHIHRKLSIFLDYYPKVELVAIEHYDYKGFSLVEMAEVSGIIKLLCHQKNKTVITVAPSALKKFATGSSTASKIMMMGTYDEKNEHIADAMALAEVALYYSGERVTTKRSKLEVIKQLKSPPKKKRKSKDKSGISIKNLDMVL